jgi:L-2,4-diaminobutyrate decarboxylase
VDKRATHKLFLNDSDEARDYFAHALDITQSVLNRHCTSSGQVYSGQTPKQLQQTLQQLTGDFSQARGFDQCMADIGEHIVANGIQLNSPHSVAHLHCPPLITAIAAELVIAATNQSMDSWNQSPAATYLEQAMVEWFCHKMGLPATADGVFTSGGTQSNLMGLLLARDHCCARHYGVDVQRQGLPADFSSNRIICSQAAHFTVQKSAAMLGLGMDKVITVPVDENKNMCVNSLRQTLEDLAQQALTPLAIVATAGTTDFGSIDPLAEIASIARQHRVWLHVDAAVAGTLAFTKNYAHYLAGIEQADSITVDLHKLAFQPISCGLFLLRDKQHFHYLAHHVDYLNPQTSQQAELNLVDKSIQTTRRFDALKLFACLATHGESGLGQLIETIIVLTGQVGDYLAAHPQYELVIKPELNIVVFRYRCRNLEHLNTVNAALPARLLTGGQANVGYTTIDGDAYLKFTLMNPQLDMSMIKHLLDVIADHARQLEEELTYEAA